jgi:hypothetical protein
MTAVTKVDFKRELRDLYLPGREPALVDVPELAFLMVDGRGDPNTSADYADAVHALFTVSYAVKFAVKRSGVADYGVMPLEGLWWVADMATFSAEDKSAWSWTAMIMQPPPVTPELVAEMSATVAKKKALPAIGKLRFERFAEGPAAQVLYRGPYAEEGPTIERLHAFIAGLGYERAGKHHEIYLTDPTRAAPEKLRTVIRQPVARPG